VQHVSIVFGPIDSRRFGRSLGINHIPLKHCTYSCVYCQLGPTPRTSIERRAFYDTATVVRAVEEKCDGAPFDVISFVPDGEPTLDLNLGSHIRAVKHFGYPVAVITNGSLLWREDVRSELAAADIVSVEVDAVSDRVWRRMDRPARGLSITRVLAGIRLFADEYEGQLWTQTMLLDGFDDLSNVAATLGALQPERICLSVPTRPPTEAGVRAADGAVLARALELIPAGELMTRDPGSASVRTTEELLAVLAVHPIREDTVDRALIDDRRMRRVEHAGTTFLCVR
jgi:wyosine [tRNA(Phe)-imidazoG37] synthetase (radical SAM superfamily)